MNAAQPSQSLTTVSFMKNNSNGNMQNLLLYLRWAAKMRRISNLDPKKLMWLFEKANTNLKYPFRNSLTFLYEIKCKKSMAVKYFSQSIFNKKRITESLIISCRPLNAIKQVEYVHVSSDDHKVIIYLIKNGFIKLKITPNLKGTCDLKLSWVHSNEMCYLWAVTIKNIFFNNTFFYMNYLSYYWTNLQLKL